MDFRVPRLLYDYMCYGILGVINAKENKEKETIHEWTLKQVVIIQCEMKVNRCTEGLSYAFVLL